MRRSAETRLLEHAIGLDHIAKPVFRTPVAAIGVGMVVLHQFLIARLDVLASRVCVKAKRFQRLGLKRLGLALARRLARSVGPLNRLNGSRMRL